MSMLKYSPNALRFAFCVFYNDGLRVVTLRAVPDRTEPSPVDGSVRRHHDVIRQAECAADSWLLCAVRLTVRLDRRGRRRPLRGPGAGPVTPYGEGVMRQGAGGAGAGLPL